jgi:hypothetical protein
VSLILSIEEAKEKGMTELVKQLERDAERRKILKLAPLEVVKDKTVRTMWRDEEPDDWS